MSVCNGCHKKIVGCREVYQGHICRERVSTEEQNVIMVKYAINHGCSDKLPIGMLEEFGPGSKISEKYAYIPFTDVPYVGTYLMNNGTVCDDETRMLCNWRNHIPEEPRTAMCQGCDF